MSYTENQPWQRECTRCRKVKCPRPEKIAEWMRALLTRTHEMVRKGTLTYEGNELWGWRDQVAHFEALIDASMLSWSHALEGLCFDCSEDTVDFAPEDACADAVDRWLKTVLPAAPKPITQVPVASHTVAAVTFCAFCGIGGGHHDATCRRNTDANGSEVAS